MKLFKPKLNLFVTKKDEEESNLSTNSSAGAASYTTPQEQIDFYNRANARYSNPNWGKTTSSPLTYDKFLGSSQYKSLADRYNYNGNKAMNDTLAKVAARTGGLASSYAASAGQGMYNDYMQSLSEAAYDMYKGEKDMEYQNNLYQMQLDEAQYQRELNAYNQQYQREQDALAQKNLETEWGIDADIRNKQYADADRDDARTRVENYLMYGGDPTLLDASILQASGYTDAEIKTLQDYVKKQNAGKGKQKETDNTPKYDSLPTTWGEFRTITGMTPAEQTAFISNYNLKGSDPETAFYQWSLKNGTAGNKQQTASDLYSQYVSSNATPKVSIDNDVLKMIDGRDNTSSKLAVIKNMANSENEFMEYAAIAGIEEDEIREWLASKGY